MTETAPRVGVTPGEPGRSVEGVVMCSGGTLCSLAALLGFVVGADLFTASAAVVLHALAVVLVWRGAALAGASRSEAELFAAAVAALSAIGAMAAWWFCVGGADRHASNAHAENDPLRLTTVRQAADLHRELGVNSYTQVVRHGSLEEKRNLLRRLAQLGSPRHIAIVRQFLFEEEPELRLCAYAELARIGQRHEQKIGELRQAAEHAGAGAAAAKALAALAHANRAYAISGVLDGEMAGYWSDQAGRIARRGLEHDPDCLAAQRVLALVLADRGDLDEAWRLISTWRTEFSPEAELIRAEVAFRRRDRHACCEALVRLDAAGVEAPEWLRTVATAGAMS